MREGELPTPGGSPFLFTLCLPLRSPRSGFVPLHGFLYGSAHKGVYRLSTGLCVGFNNIFLAFGNCNGYSVQVGGSRSCFCVRFMRDEVGANVQEQKPIQNPYRHQKTSKNSYQQAISRDNKKNLLSLGAQSVKPTRRNRSQQEKTPFEELVRMRSPVRIWVAAPTFST